MREPLLHIARHRQHRPAHAPRLGVLDLHDHSPKGTSVHPLPLSIRRVAPTEFPCHRTELQTFVADTLYASKRSEFHREIATIAPYAGPSKIQPGFEAYGRRHGIR